MKVASLIVIFRTLRDVNVINLYRFYTAVGSLNRILLQGSWKVKRVVLCVLGKFSRAHHVFTVYDCRICEQGKVHTNTSFAL